MIQFHIQDVLHRNVSVTIIWSLHHQADLRSCFDQNKLWTGLQQRSLCWSTQVKIERPLYHWKPRLYALQRFWTLLFHFLVHTSVHPSIQQLLTSISTYPSLSFSILCPLSCVVATSNKSLTVYTMCFVFNFLGHLKLLFLCLFFNVWKKRLWHELVLIVYKHKCFMFCVLETHCPVYVSPLEYFRYKLVNHCHQGLHKSVKDLFIWIRCVGTRK